MTDFIASFHLTADQSNALSMIEEFLSSDASIFILKGFAGTGKTTLVKYIIGKVANHHREYQLMAPTGRAASVIRSKTWVDARTIHSSIYFTGGMIHKGDKDAPEEMDVEFIFPLKSSISKDSHIIPPSKYVAIVDESSMISSMPAHDDMLTFGSGVLLEDLLAYCKIGEGGKIVFVGDPDQLPPVGDSESNALSEEYFRKQGIKVMSAELREVVRQGGESAIMKNILILREALDVKHPSGLEMIYKDGEVMERRPSEIPALFVEQFRADPENRPVVVTYENKRAKNYNNSIRSILFPGSSHFEKGDVLIATCNSYTMYPIPITNGDFMTVENVADHAVKRDIHLKKKVANDVKTITVTLRFREATVKLYGQEFVAYILENSLESEKTALDYDTKRALYVDFVIRMKDVGIERKSQLFYERLKIDPFYNALQVKFGYAVTCHKAQGGEWDTVYVDYTSRVGLGRDHLRWCYTATTRAAKVLNTVNMPVISPLGKMYVSQIRKTAEKDIERYKGISPEPLAAFEESVRSALDGSPYELTSIEKKPYMLICRFSTPSGERRVDVHFNAGHVFSLSGSISKDDELCNLLAGTKLYEDTPLVYETDEDSFRKLYARVSAACEEAGVRIINIVCHEERYELRYYLDTMGLFGAASLTFSFDIARRISQCVPSSTDGDRDMRLVSLVELLKNG